jgi:DNA-directed RNA polymerase specialized sigma24 family protein
MNRDELKKQLHQYRDLKAEYQQIALELEKVEAFMTAPRGIKWDAMPHGSSGGDPILGVVSYHLTLKERYEAKLVELAAAQSRIEELIESLEPVERKLFRHRYIEGLTWEEVCVAIGYSWRQTHNIHGAALDKILERINPKCWPVCESQDCHVCAGHLDLANDQR